MINKQVDYKLFFAVFALIIFWMIMISSVSVYSSFRITSLLQSSWSLEETNNHFYVLRNIIHVTIWLTALLFLVKVPYSFWEKNAKNILYGCLFLLAYVLFFWTTWNWATWWINVPWLPFALQPMEFTKFWIIIFLAYFFKKNQSKMNDFKEWFIPFFWLVLLIVFLLWMQPDFWWILMIVPVMFLMYFVAWWWVKYIWSLFLLWMFLIFSVYNIWKRDKSDPTTWNKLSYITDRFDNFLQDEKEQIAQKTINYQTEQWLIAIWSWWFAWLWFWNSVQKFWYLPEVQWDFIFSVIIEELWFIWWLVLLGFYAYIWYRWYLISYYSSDLFAKFASIWVTCWILLQAMINIWVNLNMLPLTWVTLPFISYWWSSLIALMFWLGILLNISRYADEEKWWRLWKHRSNIFSRKKTNLYQ